MATREKKASRNGEEIEAEEIAGADHGQETEQAAAELELPERPNRVLYGIGWGLGRGARAVRDVSVRLGSAVIDGLKGRPLEHEIPGPDGAADSAEHAADADVDPTRVGDDDASTKE